MTEQVQQRRKELALTSASGLALLAVALILVNVLSNWFFLRWDMTERNTYSLSPASKKLVRHLDDPVVVKAFFTPDLPAPYNSYERYVRDILTEYRAASKGKVRFEFAMTQPTKIFEQRAQEANLAPLQFEQMGSDQFAIRRGFMGLVMYFRDKSEVLPVIKDIQGLEYDITSRIARMARTQKKVILLTSGHGEEPWRTPQSRLAEDLQQMYELRDLPLPVTSSAAVQGDAIIVVGPKQRLDDKSLWTLDQAIMRGIPAAFLVDQKNFMASQFMVTPLDSGIAPLLQNYGVKLGDQLVYDAQCETVGMTQNISGFAFTTRVQYPYVALVNQLDKNQPLIQGLETVAFPFAVPLESAGAAHFTPLFTSSPRSWLAPAQTYSVAPNHIPTPGPTDPKGPFVLGALVQGSLKSYFTGKALPSPGQTLIPNSPATNLLVIGTSHQLDPSLPDFPGTGALISNIFAYLSHDETMLGIRSKGEILRPLRPTSAIRRDLVKVLAVLGVPLLVVLWGLARWRRRQNWREAIAAGFVTKPVPIA